MSADLLADTELISADLEAALDRMMGPGADDGDVYFQRRRSEHWSLEEAEVKSAGRGLRQGVGLRVVSGERMGLAHTDRLEPGALLEAAACVRSFARQGTTGRAVLDLSRSVNDLYRPADPTGSLSADEKVELLHSLDAEARRADPRVREVFISLSASHDQVLILSAERRLSTDVRPLVRLDVRVVVEQGGKREQGSAGGGGRRDYGLFVETDRAKGYAREAVRRALVNLEAREAPAGVFPVALGPGWPGVLLHEAVGHGLEGDFNRKGTSVFSGRIGEQVASELCTVVDDGSLAERRGSLNLDDEGTPTGRTVLIENGILRGYMQDRTNARLMAAHVTGNGRRESYAHLPMPRMTNTFLLAGGHSREEIIASIDKGLYAVHFGGGQVDITSGRFVFNAAEAYWVENGRIQYPVKGATLIGNGAQTLRMVSMVGDDLALDDGVGTCGKQGQSVPVGVGQPTLRVDGLTVGGTRTGA